MNNDYDDNDTLDYYDLGLQGTSSIGAGTSG